MCVAKAGIARPLQGFARVSAWLGPDPAGTQVEREREECTPRHWIPYGVIAFSSVASVGWCSGREFERNLFFFF